MNTNEKQIINYNIISLQAKDFYEAQPEVNPSLSG